MTAFRVATGTSDVTTVTVTTQSSSRLLSVLVRGSTGMLEIQYPNNPLFTRSYRLFSLACKIYPTTYARNVLCERIPVVHFYAMMCIMPELLLAVYTRFGIMRPRI